MTERKYDFPLQMGDKVQMGEMIGEVTKVQTHWAWVSWNGISETKTAIFTINGLMFDFHPAPALIIIDRPRKKVKKTLDLWVNIYEWGTETCETKEEAEECACEDAIATKVHMTGEYWVEE